VLPASVARRTPPASHTIAPPALVAIADRGGGWSGTPAGRSTIPLRRSRLRERTSSDLTTS